MNSIQDIKHVLYINLESRPDRKIHVETQLSNIGLNGRRFNAIKMKNGAIGCSISHLRCLMLAKEEKWDHVMICEDDIHFLNKDLFIKQINMFLSSHNNWDVLLLAGNNMPPYKKVDDCCIQVSRCQTTTGYLVQNHYFEKMIENIKTGIANLLKEPELHVLYAIDKFWFHLQEKDNWFLIIPLTITQIQNYSDIEQKITNYSRVMLDLDKNFLFQAK